jgi:putative ABC transport system substrate-binding protein
MLSPEPRGGHEATGQFAAPIKLFRMSGGLLSMQRRELLAGLLASMLPAAEAAQAQKSRFIGFLGTGTPRTQGPWLSALVQRLHELNWIDGRTVTIDVRWAEGRADRYAEIGNEFIQRNVDVIVTSGSAVPTLMKATTVVPIVFGVDGDPVGRGLVASLARPGRNVTGLSALAPDIAGKRAQLLRELLPQFRRLVVLGNAAFASYTQEAGELQTAGRKLGFEVISAPIRQREDIQSAFDSFKGKADAIYLSGDALVTSQQHFINTLAIRAGLPLMATHRDYALSGGLVSYGPNFPDLHRRAADYVDKILRGANPGELPVQQPTRFDLVFNLSSAKAIGIAIPPNLLARADEVIE